MGTTTLVHPVESMSKIDKQQNWEAEIEQAKSRPAMYVGGQRTAHLAAISSCLSLVRRAKAFENFHSARVHLAPRQYVVLCEAGPLLAAIKELFTWEDKYVLTEGWSAVSAGLREERRVATLETKSDHGLPEWKRHLGGPSGPTLESPTDPAPLAKRLVVAYRVSSGYWCQGFRRGFPEAVPFHIQVSSPIGLFVAADLDPIWFTGLPYTESNVQRLMSSSEVMAEWHPQDDLLPDDASSEELLANWLRPEPGTMRTG